MKNFPPQFTAAVRASDSRFTVVPCNAMGISIVPPYGTHKTIGGAVRAAWRDYDTRVRAYEAEGITRSDAQGIVDAQIMTIGKHAIAKGVQS